MPVGRNFCYKKSVSADRKFYLLVRFFIYNREKIQVIPSDCAVCLNISVKDVDDTADMRGEREHPVLFLNRVQRADYEILSFAETRFPL